MSFPSNSVLGSNLPFKTRIYMMGKPLLLTDLSLDLQIHICEFLHPLHIFALRQTCIIFQQVTLKRIIWINALIRICHQNFLFLPSFPIHDMSVAQLERAAIAPSRWIALSFSKDRTNDGFLPHRSTRMIRYPPSVSYCSPNMYLIPGGRYLVAVTNMECLNVFDLSSDGKQTRMWTTTLEYTDSDGFVVHPTLDGQGFRILAKTRKPNGSLYVYEIYPEQENPKLVQIAKIVLELKHYLDLFLYGDRAIIYSSKEKIVIVWDFMANTLAGWSVSVPTTTSAELMNWDLMPNQLIKVSETTIMIFDCYSGVWIFHIPPLITRAPLFNIERDVPEVTPILKFRCFEQVTLSYCQRPDCWRSGDLRSLPFYLDVLDSPETGLCKLEFSSDLSNHSITRISSTPADRHIGNRLPYRICEDSCVNFRVVFHHYEYHMEAVTVGSNPPSGDSSQTPNAYVNRTPLVQSDNIPSGFCPASARLVYTASDHFVICDFF